MLATNLCKKTVILSFYLTKSTVVTFHSFIATTVHRARASLSELEQLVETLEVTESKNDTTKAVANR